MTNQFIPFEDKIQEHYIRDDVDNEIIFSNDYGTLNIHCDITLDIRNITQDNLKLMKAIRNILEDTIELMEQEKNV